MGIPPGLGQRLKEERKRLGLSQEALAHSGGVQRLAQAQYEAETTCPTTRYLSAIGATGIDLPYLLLGIRSNDCALSAVQQQRVEDKAFEWTGLCAESMSDGKLNAETFKLLFKLFRTYLTQVESGQQPAEDVDPTTLIAAQMAALRQK